MTIRRRQTQFQAEYAQRFGADPLPEQLEFILREFAKRLAENNAYPPILPHIGQYLWEILSEIDTVKAPEPAPVLETAEGEIGVSDEAVS